VIVDDVADDSGETIDAAADAGDSSTRGGPELFRRRSIGIDHIGADADLGEEESAEGHSATTVVSSARTG